MPRATWNRKNLARFRVGLLVTEVKTNYVRRQKRLAADANYDDNQLSTSLKSQRTAELLPVIGV